MVSVCPGCALAAHHVLQICAESLQIIMCCHREPWDSQQHTGNSSQSNFTCFILVTVVTPVTTSCLLKGQMWYMYSVHMCVHVWVFCSLWAASSASLCPLTHRFSVGLGMEHQDSSSVIQILCDKFDIFCCKAFVEKNVIPNAYWYWHLYWIFF